MNTVVFRGARVSNLKRALEHPLIIQLLRTFLAFCEPHIFIKGVYMVARGPGSTVGKATDYGLDGLGSNPGGDEIFRPSRPALVPTQPPVKWVPGFSWG